MEDQHEAPEITTECQGTPERKSPTYFCWAKDQSNAEVFIEANNMTELNEKLEDMDLRAYKLVRGRELSFKSKTVIQAI